MFSARAVAALCSMYMFVPSIFQGYTRNPKSELYSPTNKPYSITSSWAEELLSLQGLLD